MIPIEYTQLLSKLDECLELAECLAETECGELRWALDEAAKDINRAASGIRWDLTPPNERVYIDTEEREYTMDDDENEDL